MEEKSPFFWVFAIVLALLLGAFGGWWYGNKISYTKGKSDGKAEARAEALKAAAEAANPFKQAGTNPLEKVITNPLENVKFNPFK